MRRYETPAQARREGGTRHQIAAAAKDRRHTRRRDRRQSERTWRTEWDFALRTA